MQRLPSVDRRQVILFFHVRAGRCLWVVLVHASGSLFFTYR
uniref:Uncharacterized protein n=1 Tax=Arundo donax TaxID=35708 RepID=A0A0A8ZK25_ARUDO